MTLFPSTVPKVPLYFLPRSSRFFCVANLIVSYKLLIHLALVYGVFILYCTKVKNIFKIWISRTKCVLPKRGSSVPTMMTVSLLHIHKFEPLFPSMFLKLVGVITTFIINKKVFGIPSLTFFFNFMSFYKYRGCPVPGLKGPNSKMKRIKLNEEKTLLWE